MCIIGFPWLNKVTGKAEWGVACTGCHCASFSRERTTGVLCENAGRRLYSEVDFLVHAVECRHARRVFLERFGKMNGDEILLSPDQVCDVAGDLASVKIDKDKFGNPLKHQLDRVFWLDVQKHIDARTGWERGFGAL